MKRYRAVFAHTASGGFDEFSAADDDAALAHADDMTHIYGRLVWMSDVSVPNAVRRITLPGE